MIVSGVVASKINENGKNSAVVSAELESKNRIKSPAQHLNQLYFLLQSMAILGRHPEAPVHFLVIPKKFIPNLAQAKEEDKEVHVATGRPTPLLSDGVFKSSLMHI